MTDTNPNSENNTSSPDSSDSKPNLDTTTEESLSQVGDASPTDSRWVCDTCGYIHSVKPSWCLECNGEGFTKQHRKDVTEDRDIYGTNSIQEITQNIPVGILISSVTIAIAIIFGLFVFGLGYFASIQNSLFILIVGLIGISLGVLAFESRR